MIRIQFSYHVIVELLLLAVIVFLVGGSPVVARPNTTTQAAVPGGPGYITINSWAFVPYISDPTKVFKFKYYGATLVNTSTDNTLRNFIAPVYLPNGATITKLTLYYYDNELLDVISLKLHRYDMVQSFTDPTRLAIVDGDTTQSVSFRNKSDTTINNPVIDLSSYTYFLGLDLPNSPDISFAGARIDYSFPTMLPLLAKENN